MPPTSSLIQTPTVGPHLRDPSLLLVVPSRRRLNSAASVAIMLQIERGTSRRTSRTSRSVFRLLPAQYLLQPQLAPNLKFFWSQSPRARDPRSPTNVVRHPAEVLRGKATDVIGFRAHRWADHFLPRLRQLFESSTVELNRVMNIENVFGPILYQAIGHDHEF